METDPAAPPQRASSTSTASTSSDPSRRRRRPRKPAAAPKTPTLASTAATSASASAEPSDNPALTSFPSLSPETPPSRGAPRGLPSPPLAKAPPPATARRAGAAPPPSIAALTANSPSFRGGLFDDTPTTAGSAAGAAAGAAQGVPGAAHHASDAQLARLVARAGAVPLVRQLAADLAARDAELSRARGRAEARERELKKMLREVEVSNLDIEKRLKRLEERLERDGADGEGERRGSDGRVSAMMNEALGEEVGGQDDDGEGEAADPQATIRARREGDGVSIQSVETTESKGGKGWREYLWKGSSAGKSSQTSSIHSQEEDQAKGRACAGSGTAAKRRGLSENSFKPPPPGRGTAADMVKTADKPRATSMSSWTLKIFAGKPTASKDSSRPASRGRAATQSATRTDNARNASQNSEHSAGSGRPAPAKARTQSSSQQLLPKSLRPLNVGPASALKTSGQSIRSLPISSPASESAPQNLGPVEMDAILPQGTRPPTLTPSYQNLDDASDYLTDRFGFIYDSRRRKKEAEVLASLAALKGKGPKDPLSLMSTSADAESVSDTHGSRPGSPASGKARSESEQSGRWQDHLTTPTYPTELLIHSPGPSPGTIMTLANEDIKSSLKRTPTFERSSGAPTPVTLNPTLTPSTVTANNADLARPVISAPDTPATPTKSDSEPVKALLAQLTEVHDRLQQEKEVKWNEFMRKVRAERRREGEAAGADPRSKTSATPEASLADGETIGIATLGHKGKVGRAKYKEFKALVLAGIPVAHRAKVWAECSGAAALRVPGYYADLASPGAEAADDDPAVLAQIQMDIRRTLTDNVFFRTGPGVGKLEEVLLAYARRNPEVGYCQGMNLIAASLLLILPTAEDAFWLLAACVETLLPRHYYDRSLLASRADQRVLRAYVAELLPRLSEHLAALGVELEALTFQWFLSLFTDCLSAEALYRVWDVLLASTADAAHGGSTFLFQVALALLKLNEAPLLRCATPGAVYAYLGGEITNHAISIDGLIRASDGLRGLVQRADVEERRKKWVEVEEETLRERERIRQEMKAVAKGKKGEVGPVEARSGREAASVEDGLQVQAPIPVED